MNQPAPFSLRRLAPYLFLTPAFVALAAVVAIPIGYGLWLSVHRWKLATFAQGVPFIGLENYEQALGDAAFWHSLGITLVFTLTALTIEMLLGLGVAVLLDQSIRGGNVVQALILLPMFMTNVIVGLIWRMMMSYDFGVLNWFVSLLGVDRVAWLGNPSYALPSLILVDVWNTTPFVALILLAGLRAVPNEPREAAQVDGASAWQLFRYVILPTIRPLILVAMVWRTIDLFRIFDVVFSLTGGGPYNATEVISLFTYRQSFASFNLGYASALSYIMVAVMLALVALQVRFVGRRDEP